MEGFVAQSYGDALAARIGNAFHVADFKQLLVWRKAHALSLNVHRVAARIRGSRYSSLRSQMIRAAMSIPTNIVEGRGQKSDREFARFLRYSLQSTSELEYHLITALDFGVISRRDFDSLLTQIVEVRRMLHGLLARIEFPKNPPSP